MKVLETGTLAIEAIKVIRFKRFGDQRGYFTEHYRKSDLRNHPETVFMRDVEFVQGNESYSKKGTIRGMHFQWNPYMGKMVRTITGRMIDMVLDIRKGSPTCGKMLMYDMPADPTSDSQEWIWVPPGFAHGNVFPQDTIIEYLCSGEYSQGCEAGISPLAPDIDWSLCDGNLKEVFDTVSRSTNLMTDKDRSGLSLEAWMKDERSKHFTLQALR